MWRKIKKYFSKPTEPQNYNISQEDVIEKHPEIKENHQENPHIVNDSNDGANATIDERSPASTELTTPYNPNTGYKIPAVDVLPVNNHSCDSPSDLEAGKKRIEWVLATQGITVNSIANTP